MSGIAGCFFFEENQEIPLDDIITCMLNAPSLDKNQQTAYYSNSKNFAFGIYNGNNVISAQIIDNNKRNYNIVFNGSLTNIKELVNLAKMKVENEHSVESEIIMNMYEKNKNGIVDYLKGIYSYAIWNKDEKKLNIATDRYGYEFIYYYKDKRQFLFASEVKCILKILNCKPEANINAICDMHNFNAVFNSYTPFKSINIMPHAGICTVSKTLFNIKQYWDYPMHVDHFSDNEEVLMENAKTLIQNAVMYGVEDVDNLGIMLSGGLDSRLLAAVAKKRASNIRAFSFRYGEEKTKDNIIAERIAKQLGVEFHYLDKTKIDIVDFVNKNIIETDGQWGFNDLLPYIIEIKNEYPDVALLNGYLMDTLFKSGWAFFPKDDNNLITTDKIMKTYSTMSDYLSDMLFLPDFADLVKKNKRRTIETSNKDLPSNKPAELSLRFYCINRGRRSLISGINMLKRYRNIILPGTDYDLVDFAFRLPYKIRSSSNFYRKLIYTSFPEISRIPWDRTGKPLDKGLNVFGKSIEPFLFKARYAFQRLTRGKIDLTNFPNSFNSKFRNDKNFRESVKDILYDRKTLSRGFFNQKGIETLIEQELSGRDYHRAFQSILSVEMLFRNFIDE